MSDDFVRCECCGKKLEIVCPNGHADPMEKRRGSGGPVPFRGVRQSSLPSVKRCRTCNADKPVGDFYLSKGYPFPDCKPCHAANVKARKRTVAA